MTKIVGKTTGEGPEIIKIVKICCFLRDRSLNDFLGVKEMVPRAAKAGNLGAKTEARGVPGHKQLAEPGPRGGVGEGNSKYLRYLED